MASRTIIKSGDGANPRSIILMLTGAALVVFGGVLLLSVGLTVVEILDDPSNVKIVALILQEMQGQGNALSGDVDGSRFSIAIGEPLRTLLFLVLVAWLLGVLVSILKTLVLTGKDLIAAADRADSD